MKTVVVMCEKGGVGKSAISDELVYHFDRCGVPVSLYSLDGQYSKRGRVDKRAEVSVVDTAGSLGDNFGTVVSAADVIVVPTRPSFADVEPLVRTVDLIRGACDAQIVIVVNATTPYTMTNRFLGWITQQTWGYPIVTIPQSEAFAQVIGTGESIVGHDRRGKVSAAVIGLCNLISSFIGLPRE